MPILNQLTRDALLDRTMDAANQAELISDIGAAKAHLLVADNDAKQLLTSLSDGQEVEVVGEAGRIERYNGDNAGLLTSLNVSDAGSPVTGITSADASGLYVWNGSYFQSPSTGMYVQYLGGKWVIGAMSPAFESDACASTVHPSDATGWTAINGSTGTIADVTGVTALPEATESNWSTIVNTIELYGNVGYATITINGVLIEPVNTDIRVGWVKPTDAMLSSFANPWYVKSIDGFSESNTTGNFQGGDGMTLPQPFPNGATVVIRNT